MVLLETLLPVLLEGEGDHAGQDKLLGVRPLIDELADHGITTDADLLFVSPSAKLSIEAVRTLEALQVRDKIAHFLAAEGSAADELYSQDKATSTQSTIARDNQDLCSTGVEAVDKLLDGGWAGEVVELLGETGTGKTWLALHTVLKRLHEHPTEQALWLDTTASFSAEQGSQILQSITASSKTLASASDPSRQTTEATEQPPNALDRLIVAKVFDLQAAIQAIQQVRSQALPKEEDKTKREESKVPTDPPAPDTNMAVDSDATVYSNEVPETGRPAIDLLQSSADPSAQMNITGDSKEGVEKAASLQNGSKAISTQPHLRFIVIDSISALLKGVLNATSAEGHARMLSFMRLLRSLTITSHSSSTTSNRKTTIFLINNLVSLASTANSTDALHSIFPALNAKRYKAALGPTFTYLTDWTIYLSNVRDVFPQYGLGGEMEGDEARKRFIFEVVRSRRMGKWATL